MQQNKLARYCVQDSVVNEPAPLKINVFTSSSCTFCNEALEAAREAAQKFRKLHLPIEVIETPVEEKPELVEALNVIALPVILIGKSQIVGLPQPGDIELLLHQSVLTG